MSHLLHYVGCMLQVCPNLVLLGLQRLLLLLQLCVLPLHLHSQLRLPFRRHRTLLRRDASFPGRRQPHGVPHGRFQRADALDRLGGLTLRGREARSQLVVLRANMRCTPCQHEFLPLAARRGTPPSSVQQRP